MSKSQPEINLVFHFPRSPDGMRILIGRIALFNKLIDAQRSGKKFNLSYEVSQFTDEDALCAYWGQFSHFAKQQ